MTRRETDCGYAGSPTRLLVSVFTGQQVMWYAQLWQLSKVRLSCNQKSNNNGYFGPVCGLKAGSLCRNEEGETLAWAVRCRENSIVLHGVEAWFCCLFCCLVPCPDIAACIVFVGLSGDVHQEDGEYCISKIHRNTRMESIYYWTSGPENSHLFKWVMLERLAWAIVHVCSVELNLWLHLLP